MKYLFFVIVYFLSGFLEEQRIMDTTLRHDRYFESGRKFYQGSVPVVVLHGSWFQMGRQYGALMRDELEKVYAFACKNKADSCYRNLLGDPETPSSITGLRRYDELFRGMSQTSYLTLEQLRIVNAVEVLCLDQVSSGLQRIFDSSRCSTLAACADRTYDGKTIVGRNYDWLPEFKEIADTLVLSIFHPADGSNAVASFNWSGCMYLTTGMNNKGLYLGLNSGFFADPVLKTERIHHVWMLWEILCNSDEFAAVRRYFNTTRAAASYLILGASPAETECFQWHTKGVWESGPRSGDLLAASNHFASEGWINDPLAESTQFASSVQRRENLLALAKNHSRIGVEEMMQILSVPFPEGGAKVDGTLFQIIASPADQTWYIRTCCMDDWAQIPMFNLLRVNGELV